MLRKQQKRKERKKRESKEERKKERKNPPIYDSGLFGTRSKPRSQGSCAVSVSSHSVFVLLLQKLPQSLPDPENSGYWSSRIVPMLIR